MLERQTHYFAVRFRHVCGTRITINIHGGSNVGMPH